MPMRYIKVPPAVTFYDPLTDKPILDADNKPEVWSFKTLIQKVMANPKWTETLVAMRAQDAILRACKDAQDDVVVLAEEPDWRMLKEAIETPRMIVGTTQGLVTISGFGQHPRCGAQILPLLQPIVDATTEPPASKPRAVGDTKQSASGM